jgi:hypothetical protein
MAVSSLFKKPIRCGSSYNEVVSVTYWRTAPVVQTVY